MPTLWLAVTVVVMGLNLEGQAAIAVSNGGVCANTQGSFDCDCVGTGFG